MHATLQARLARRCLPRCTSDGIIKHSLNPNDFPSWLPNESDADIEWVLLGSGTASNTPTKMSCRGHKHSRPTAPTQVSFDLSSDNSAQPECLRRPSVKAAPALESDTTCDDCEPRVHILRKRRTRADKFRAQTSESSSNSESVRSDDSRGERL